MEGANRSVDRACRLMSAFTQQEPALTLSELSRRTALPKATVHRMAATLLARGMLTQRLDGRYELGVKLLELGAIVRENLDVVKLCRPVIDALASSTGETVVVAAADWSTREMLLVARRDSPHPLAVGSPVGRRMPIPPGGVLGKALLVGLEPREAEVVVGALELVPTTANTLTERGALLRNLSSARARGYVSEQDEYIEGASGVAVPVIFEGNHPLAAIGVVGPTSRLASQVHAVGPLLRNLTATLRPAGSAGE
ncbi:MAG: IclR family transcriptional regulator [Solirubrobacterales bacterium]|nr:IclR family transcriptional regulator [Solirubrobacterales bacterium]